jgi:hypothetical protein
VPVRSGVTPTLINRAVWIRRNIGRRSCPEADLGQSGLGGIVKQRPGPDPPPYLRGRTTRGRPPNSGSGR